MEYNVTPQLPDNGLTVAELFAGGGLMAAGLKSAGYSLVWANDFEKNPCLAYAHNIGQHILQADITTVGPDALPGTDIIAGGPPCQDFSTAGKGAGEEGDRGKLVWTYLNIIKEKQPKAFIFENVPGLASKKHKHTLDTLLEQFADIGYTVSHKGIDAWDHGIAQRRKRIFIVGIRNDMGFTYRFPEPHQEDCQTQVLRDVIGDLPSPGTPLTEVQLEYFRRNPASFDKNRPVGMDEPSRTLPAVLYKGIPYGLFYANHNPGSYWTPKSDYAFAQANRVMSMDKPSNTIPAHHNSGQPQHPVEYPRRFTIREALRIQSVPDWYVLPESISLSAQYRIVGNGVASRVAYLLGQALAEQLRAAGI